ncbi:glutathione S-transferase domain-containing protein [Xylariaceae sp. FL0255]|nr:glutathione S-transferase domain-containing protein [Xylariaceae sp. FL0255]
MSSSASAYYELIYWPGAPGRGEHVRLAFEEAGVPYSDTSQMENAMEIVAAQTDATNRGDKTNPPPFVPPILNHGDIVFSQTPNILVYLGPKLGLSASGTANDVYWISALALTALDGLSNEVHDCHPPIAKELYYEDQKQGSIRKSKEWVKFRLPKHLGYFDKVLSGGASGDGPWLYKGVLTYADLVLFHCLDGTMFQFRKASELAKKSGQFNRVFQLYDAVRARPNIKTYLSGDRRWAYSSLGIYRYYEELDVVAE